MPNAHTVDCAAGNESTCARAMPPAPRLLSHMHGAGNTGLSFGMCEEKRAAGEVAARLALNTPSQGSGALAQTWDLKARLQSHPCSHISANVVTTPFWLHNDSPTGGQLAALAFKGTAATLSASPQSGLRSSSPLDLSLDLDRKVSKDQGPIMTSKGHIACDVPAKGRARRIREAVAALLSGFATIMYAACIGCTLRAHKDSLTV